MTLQTPRVHTLEQVRRVAEGTEPGDLALTGRALAYDFIFTLLHPDMRGASAAGATDGRPPAAFARQPWRAGPGHAAAVRTGVSPSATVRRPRGAIGGATTAGWRRALPRRLPLRTGARTSPLPFGQRDSASASVSALWRTMSR